MKLKQIYYNLKNDGFMWEHNHPEIYFVSEISDAESYLPVYIGVNENHNWKKIKGKKYIQVQNGYQRYLNPFSSIKISIDDFTPQILHKVKLKIEDGDLEQVLKFIALNRENLLKLWDNKNYCVNDFLKERKIVVYEVK